MVETADLVGEPLDGVEIIFAGDICYTEAMAGQTIPWLRGLAAEKTIISVIQAAPAGPMMARSWSALI